MKKKLSPSLLSADFTKLGEQIKTVEAAGAHYLHLDVMDGVFVPNISFGITVIQGIRKASNMVFDVHLMIIEPEKYVEAFRNAGANIINFHAEATQDISGTIRKIKALGAKAGITIKPGTPVADIKPYLSELDLVLIMTVEPGFGGQKFMADQLDKIRELKMLREEKKYFYEIEIDGGITKENLKEVLEAGTDVIVAGSAVFGARDIEEAVKEFEAAFQEFA